MTFTFVSISQFLIRFLKLQQRMAAWFTVSIMLISAKNEIIFLEKKVARVISV